MTEDRYAEAGVDYAVLDAGKRAALAAARATVEGSAVDAASLGEQATIVRAGDESLGVVLECLGTKSLVAAEYEQATGEDRFFAVGYDTVAAAVNDCVSVGALPLCVNAYFACGSGGFYEGSRHASLVGGFARACADAGCAWGGGESPALPGIVEEGAVDLAAAAVGRLPRGCEPLLGEALRAGDEIVLIASSGIHQNGASLARRLAASLAAGWQTPLSSGRLFAEAVLEPGHIYAPLVGRLLAEAVPLHYVSHLTGHGLRKLMRADRQLTYRLERLPEVPEVIGFIVDEAGLSPEEAYATFNMGAGLAVIGARGSAEAIVSAAASLGLAALAAGHVEQGRRRVVLEPVGVDYEADRLSLR